MGREVISAGREFWDYWDHLAGENRGGAVPKSCRWQVSLGKTRGETHFCCGTTRAARGPVGRRCGGLPGEFLRFDVGPVFVRLWAVVTKKGLLDGRCAKGAEIAKGGQGSHGYFLAAFVEAAETAK